MIKVLSKNVSDKIAAGEVIERPVSIVKELVENSIDSGASNITVEIKNGGKTFIRVTDNGCGIPSDEAETAFLRHATSKIDQVSDLETIQSLGFRGEALASIAAVTRTTLITKVQDSKLGRQIVLHGGEIIENKGIGCPDGTTLIVNDLFYNTPARRDFLKSDSAESGMIIDFVSEIALAYPDLKFQLINNGNILFATSGDGDMKTAIMTVFRQREYKDLINVDYENGNYKVKGCISKPSLSRTTRRDQVFFVNGRVVNSKVIEKGISEGYKERLFDGRYPVTYIAISTDPASVDVNIHPNKREVRFHDEKDVIEAVADSIEKALGSDEAVIEVHDYFIDKDKKSERKTDDRKEQVDIKQILYSKRNESHVNDIDRIDQNKVLTRIDRERANDTKPDITIEASNSKPFDFNDLRITGCLFDTYITAVDSENFYMIDQHAAHERIFYERLVGEYISEEKTRQPILTPIVIDVPLSAKENQYSWLEPLNEMGYQIEEFGPNSYIIKEIPAFMELSEAEGFANIFIENTGEHDNLTNTVVINKLITKSCKSAVKAHDHLSAVELEALLDELKECRNPFSCPHGRPTFVRFSLYDIEKLFKRV